MDRLFLVFICGVFALAACQSAPADPTPDVAPTPPNNEAPTSEPASRPAHNDAGQTQLAPAPAEGEQVATFAGGCFWCMEGPFEKLDGVRAVLSGYTGGPEEHPSYKQVSASSTGHTEAVIVYFDPARVSYDKLLDTYWRSFDPTDAEGQFADRGPQYRPAIFAHSPEQRQAAEASRKALGESKVFDEPIVVPIEDAKPFWVAEDYHQDYYKTNPGHYNAYRKGSGRAGFIEKHWGGR